jgi:signal peptidase I
LSTKKATWRQAIGTLLLPLALVMFVRWVLVEPYVIPSSSMNPGLQVHDHILVNKLAYGLRLPFMQKWLVKWSGPQKGQVVVFRYPEKPELFYVKRVVAVAGDEVEVIHGKVFVNGEKHELVPLENGQLDFLKSHFAFDEDFQFFKELVNQSSYMVRYKDPSVSFYKKTKIPEGKFFVMGDNRDESYDSRFWGFVSENALIGKATWIWLACNRTLESAPSICDPSQIRWNRLLLPVL